MWGTIEIAKVVNEKKGGGGLNVWGDRSGERIFWKIQKERMTEGDYESEK